MVTDAQWGDMDADGDIDLVIVNDWGSVSILDQTATGLVGSPISGTSGLWRSLQLVDLDKDGRLDIVAGNWGQNSKFRASETEPLKMYVADFDENGSVEQIVTQFIDGREGLFATKDELTGQLVSIKNKLTA